MAFGCGWYWPVLHDWHSLIPGLALNVPGEHGMQDTVPFVDANHPASQISASWNEPLQRKPGAQTSTDVCVAFSAANSNDPGGMIAHEEEPSPSLMYPAGQSKHDVLL